MGGPFLVLHSCGESWTIYRLPLGLEQEGYLMGAPQVFTWVWQLKAAAKGEATVELHSTLWHLFDI